MIAILFGFVAFFVYANLRSYSSYNSGNGQPDGRVLAHFHAEHNSTLRRATFRKNSINLDGGKIPIYLAPPSNHSSGAQRVIYKGKITACDNTPTKGRLFGEAQFQYWKLWLQAGTKVKIEVERVDCDMDPIATLFYGTTDFGAFRLVDWGDNENEIPFRCPPESSPNKDPKLVVKQIPFTGEYTLQVYQNAENPGNQSRYKIKVLSRDYDGDGVGEACDRCPLTNLNTNVTLLSCDTGIPDRILTGDGCSLNDIMLNTLRSCNNRAKKSGKPYRERRNVFKNCMQRRMGLYVNGTDLDSVMKCASKIHEKAIQKACGNRLLATDQQDLYIVDHTTGKKQFIGELGSAPRCSKEIEYDYETGNLWSEKCGNSPELFRADPSNGNPIDLVRHEQGDLTGMEMVGDTLYGTFVPEDSNPNNTLAGHPYSTLVIVNTTTGELTRIGNGTGVGPIAGLAYDLSKKLMWGVTSGPDPDATATLVTIDLTTGNATKQMPVVDKMGRNLTEIKSLEFGPDRVLYGGVYEYAKLKRGTLVRISTSTGRATKVKTQGLTLVGLTCFTI